MYEELATSMLWIGIEEWLKKVTPMLCRTSERLLEQWRGDGRSDEMNESFGHLSDIEGGSRIINHKPCKFGS